MIKRIVIITLALLMAFSSWCNIVPGLSNQVAAAAANYVAHYPLIEDVQDISGNEMHGEAVGNISYSDGLTLPGGTNSGTNYVKLPDGLLDNQDSVTISIWLKSNTGSGNYSALFFGTPANSSKVPTNYWLFNPTNPDGNFKSVFTDSSNSGSPWTTEVGVSSAPTTQYGGEWVHYTTVISPTSITGYINGDNIGTVNKTKTTSSFGTDLNVYIGRSNYLNDHTFAGSFQDLRIYGEALDDAGVAAVYTETFNEKLLQQSKKELTLGNVSAVIGSFSLPTTDSHGAAITWESSDESAISTTGEVFLKEATQYVTLTATIALGDSQLTKEFNVTLVSKPDLIATVADALYIPHVLSGSDSLPSSLGIVDISWDSSNPTVVAADGTINPPAAGLEEVTLTATLSYEGEQRSKIFTVKVIEADPAYVLSYTRTGGTVVTDAMHLGYSKDGASYTPLNNNSGVLFAKADFEESAALGFVEGVTKKLINPYLFRMHDDTFGVAATRLADNGSQTEDEKSSILLFTSSNLTTYHEVGLVPLHTTETVTQPVIEFDAASGAYIIEWKSADGTSYYNTTTDFINVSPPQLGAKISREQVATSIDGAVAVNRVAITFAEAEVVTNKLTKVTNTEVANAEINVEIGEAFTFDDLRQLKVTASYNDGSIAEKAVYWNESQFNAIDFNQAGTYTVSGTVKQVDYPYEMIPDAADPNVFLYNGSYYFIATNENGQNDLNIRKADTILALKDSQSHRIFTAKASGELSGSIWAPELHEINGNLYVLFAAGSPQWWSVQSYMMKLKDGGDPTVLADWENPIRVVKQNGEFLREVGNGLTLDMTYFEHNGKHYVIWAGGGAVGTPEESSNNYIATIDPEQPWKLTSDISIINKPDYGWERLTSEVVEGSYVIKHGDQVFMTYSGSNIDLTYSIGLLSAHEDSDLLDPASWSKLNYPLLNSASVPGEYGPGHNSFTVDEDGNAVNIYHTKPFNGGTRDMTARRVHWAADGTPVLDMILDREILPQNRAVTATINVGSSEADHLILHYDMKTTDVVDGQFIVKDVANKAVAYDGLFRNPSNGQHVSNSEVGFVSFNGGSSTSNSGYVEIPKGTDGQDILSGLNEITVSSIVNWTNDGTNRWIFGFGTVLTPETNKYFFTTPRHGIGSGNQIATGISKNGWPNEALVTGAANSNLIGGQWKQVTVSFSEASDTLNLYVDGAKIASGSARGLKLAEIINPTASFSGFLGKSIFSNDPYFQGSIADFRVYNRAFTDQEAVELYLNEGSANITQIRQLTVEDAVNQLNIAAYLGEGDQDADKITRNLTLPTSGKNGVSIVWSSSHPSVLANNGTVTRPAADAADVELELTATLTYQGISETVLFSITVLKEFDEQQKVDLDAEALTIYNENNVKGNLRLTTTGEHGSTITWVSDNPAVIKGSAEAMDSDKQLGWIARQAADTDVTLTATITNGTASAQRSFDVTVVKAPQAIDYDAYFFAYFTGEYEGGEEISFASAEDPLFWRALNNGKSVIQSNMGEKGLRDPFIIRSHEGDRFYMLATDLKMGESTNFDQAQITGSHYMMIWESEDLVNWSEQRMIEVAPKNGGNTWAPEAIYDEVTGEYVVFWASSMKNSDTYGDYNGRPAGQYNVMYYATTRDFYHFSEPEVMIDESLPTIDTTFIKHEDVLYRLTKSEVNYKVYVEKADNFYYDKDGIEANGFQFEPVLGTRDGKNGLIGHSGNNEGQTIFKDLKADKWYLFLDSWPYHVRYTTDLNDGSQYINNVLNSSQYALPPGPRHGTVIPITRAEYDAVQAKYALPGPVESDGPVVHYTFDPNSINGTTVTDVSGNGHDAALMGGASVNEQDRVGTAGGAVDLDGTSGYVKLPDNLIQDLNLEKATFSTWVKIDTNQANQRIFDFASETGRQVNRNTMYLSTQGDTGNLEFAIVTPFTEKFSNESTLLGSSYKYALRSSSLLSTNAWQHVAITIDEFDAVLYVNGQEAATSSTYNVEPRMLLETTMNYIGKSRRDAHSLFDGKFDDFRIYNRALSAEEISLLADEEATTPVETPSGAELILHYDMKNIDGTTVKDETGSFDGTWVNSDKAEWIHSAEAGVLSFAGGTNNSYVELPAGVLDDVSDITVSTLVNWSGKASAEWLYAVGRPNTETHYSYFTPQYNADSSTRFGLATNGWRDEVSVRSATSLKSNEWKLVTTVLSSTDGTLTLYVDGTAIASGTTNGIALAQIKNATGSSGYLAKSFYAADPYFGGMIADFQIYKGAMTASEVAELQTTAKAKIALMDGMLLQAALNSLTHAQILGTNSSQHSVTSNLLLPANGDFGTTITWASSNTSVITNDGKVTRPLYEAGDQAVTLTATISDGVNSVTKELTVTVVKLPNDGDAVQLDKAALIVYNINDVRGNLTLPTAGDNGTTITWVSAQPDLITATGEVQRPANGKGDTAVTLTATITRNGISATREFTAMVKELPVEQNYAAYFFSYFTGEGSSNGEQIYFALSEGNDPLHWQELNDGQPELISNLGEKGLRDPFIIRSPEGDKFYMIATDLKIHGNGNWGRAQTWGSRSIMVWESNDLVNWSEQRMVEIAPPEAGNTWAPEIFYDDTTGEYVVFWASRLFDNEEHTGSAYQKMMYSKTRDFYTFTEPQVYMDYGYSIIDTTMIKHDGKIYRFSKDERNNEAASPYGKMIFQEVGDSVLDESFTMINQAVGSIKWVEGPTIFKSNTEEKWYLFVDEFGGRGYVPFETTDLASGQWTLSSNYNLPAHPRHGTVIPITQTEYDAIYAKYLAEQVSVTGVSLDKTILSLLAGETAQLTATVAPADATNKAVAWSSSDQTVATVSANGVVKAVKAGTATITVTTNDGDFTATAVVTVNRYTPPINPQPEQPTEPEQPTGPEQPTEPEQPTNPEQPELPKIEFTDVPATHWAASAINRAAALGIVRGHPDHSFKPNAATTRAEFITMLANAFNWQDEPKQPNELNFNDQEKIGAWAEDAIAQAVKRGVITGYTDGSFRPNQKITRTEMTVVLARVLDIAPSKIERTGFADDAAIPAWSKGAVEALREKGLVGGRANNSFAPNAAATRAETLVIILRALNLN